MKLSRNFTNKVNWILDNVIPPFIRDSKLFSFPLIWVFFGKNTKMFMSFKNKVPQLNHEDIVEYYKKLGKAHIDRETDLNTDCVNYVLNNISGNSILDIACGRGYLAKKIVERHGLNVIGIDFVIDDLLTNSQNPKFIEGNVESIPFPDKYFDTVICAHTLEHVVDIQKCITELRRVCKGQLIIVLPKQRPYKYTFDLHIHFFPYQFTVLNLFKNINSKCYCIKNDWVYHETVE